MRQTSEGRYRGHLLFWAVFVGLIAAACSGGSGAYETAFDAAGKWGVGDEQDVQGSVVNGTYQLFVKSETGVYWSTAGQDKLGDGVYELEATQLEGPLDNGYGMMFRVDSENDNFYLFEVSGDGYVWIGWCESGCQSAVEPIVGEGWNESAAVNTGLNNTNTLRVEVLGDNLSFSVNGQQVGQATDSRGNNTGDIGLLVETLGEGGVRVAFDNFRVTPSTGN